MGQQITMELLLILCTLLLNDEAYSDYIVQQSPNPSLWVNSGHICSAKGRNSTFAVPDVNLLTMTVKDKISLTEEAWVGYFQSYEYFRVLVCVPLNIIEFLVTAQFSTGKNENGPGLCYSICGLQGLIGLQATRCFCITTRNFSILDVPNINSSCKDPLFCRNDMLCGYEGNNTIAVYENVSISTSSIRGDGIGCIIVTNNSTREMSVVNCSNNYHHLCESSTAHIRDLDVSHKTDQWVYTVTDCTETGKRPTSYIGDGTQYKFPNISGSWWITVVRDLVIRNRSESGSMKETPLFEGFLENSSGRIKLEFVSARKNLTRKSVVCISDLNPKDPTQTTEQPDIKQWNGTHTSTMTTTTSSTSKAPTTALIPGQEENDQWNQTNKQATTTLTSSAPETSTTTQIPEQPGSKQWNGTHTSTMTTTTSSTSKAPTTALIPVLTTILPIGLIAAFIALIILYVKRRTVKVTESVVLSNAESRHKYYKHENDQGGNVCPEYDTFKENDAPAYSGTWNIYDRANFNICDGTYDVTFSANNPIQKVQAHLYDHLSPKKANDGNYDIADLQEQRNRIHRIETYDQTNAIASENGNYDTFKQKFKLHQQCEQNVYDTANFHTTK